MRNALMVARNGGQISWKLELNISFFFFFVQSTLISPKLIIQLNSVVKESCHVVYHVSACICTRQYKRDLPSQYLIFHFLVGNLPYSILVWFELIVSLKIITDYNQRYSAGRIGFAKIVTIYFKWIN